MTAQLINNPWTFNPGDPSAAIVALMRMKIVQVEYVGYTSASDTVEIQNQLGQIVWAGDGKTDLDTVRSGRIGWINGLLVPVLTSQGLTNIPSGQLLIYFE